MLQRTAPIAAVLLLTSSVQSLDAQTVSAGERVRATIDGSPRRVSVCTSCIKAGKVSR